MGLKTYLGLNFPIVDLLVLHNSELVIIQNEVDYNALEIVKKTHLKSRFVNVIEMNGELDNLNPQSKIETPVDYENARESLRNLHSTLQENIPPDDFAEVYFCWADDEAEEKLGYSEISLKHSIEEEILAEERFLITFTNKSHE